MLDKRTSVGLDLSLKALAVGLMLTDFALGAIGSLSYSFKQSTISTPNSRDTIIPTLKFTAEAKRKKKRC